MANEEIYKVINELVNSIIAEIPDIFLVQLVVKATNNIKVFIDTDEGVSIDSCIKVNRKLYNAVEEAGIFPEGDFSIEVSSPGIGEPILLTRQYQKSIGRYLALTLKDDTKLEGKLFGCTPEGITLEETTGKGKKMVINTHSVLFEDIKKATIEVKF